MKAKIVDCFTFYNELDMLSYRLKVLNDHVDYFVLVESAHTFKGNKKEIFFDKNKKLYSKYLHKIIHVIVEDMPNSSNPWDNEYHQRNCIKRGIDQLNLNDNDLVIISDVDEIPNINKLDQVDVNKINTLEMLVYYYNLNCVSNYSNRCSRVLSYKILKNFSCQEIRRKNENTISKSGWHLSYFGNLDWIINKLKEFSHCNDSIVTEIIDSDNIKDKIKSRIKKSKDLFSERGCKFRHLEIQDNKDLPPFIDFFKTR